MNLKEMQKEIHETAKQKGWYDRPRTTTDFICLFYSEIAEAFEDFRNKGHVSLCFFEELADVVIRILDYCEYQGVSLETFILQKMEKNRKRSYRHGNKAL